MYGRVKKAGNWFRGSGPVRLPDLPIPSAPSPQYTPNLFSNLEQRVVRTEAELRDAIDAIVSKPALERFGQIFIAARIQLTATVTVPQEMLSFSLGSLGSFGLFATEDFVGTEMLKVYPENTFIQNVYFDKRRLATPSDVQCLSLQMSGGAFRMNGCVFTGGDESSSDVHVGSSSSEVSAIISGNNFFGGGISAALEKACVTGNVMKDSFVKLSGGSTMWNNAIVGNVIDRSDTAACIDTSAGQNNAIVGNVAKNTGTPISWHASDTQANNET